MACGGQSRLRFGLAVHAMLAGILMTFGLATSVDLMAQRSTYRQYGYSDGLTDMTVYCLLQDHVGYIWVCTDNGLFRYDGSRFLGFHNEDGLPDATVRAIAESPEGVLWVATMGGVARSVGRRFQTVNVGESGVFKAIAFDRLGRMYLEDSSGIIRGMPDGKGSYRFQKVAAGKITGLEVHGDDVWFGRDGDVWHLVDELAERVGSPAGLPPGLWTGIFHDPAGDLWMQSATRLYELPLDQTRFVDRSAGLPAASFTGLNGDSHGRVFLSSDAGVTVLDGNRLIPMDARHGLPADGARRVLVDREGSLWIGTSGSGLIRQLGGGNWVSWKKEDGLLHNTVWAIHEDRAGQAWVGTSGGLNMIDASGMVTRSWTGRTGMAGDEVFAIAQGPAGDIYASTYPTGISRFTDKGVLVETYRSASAMATGWILAMAFDQQGRLWTTGATGCFRSRLALGDGEPSFERVDIPGMGTGTRFEDVLVDGNTTWVSSYRGLARLIEGKWRVFNKRDGLRSDAVSVMALGPDGLWIAYADALGLTRLAFDGAQVKATHVTKEDGLASNRIFAVASDPGGRLWASSDAGVDVLDQRRWRHYGTEDGLIWNDANSYALDADQKGDVWVGTSAGLSRYSPPRFPVAASAPRVVITSIEGTFRQWNPDDHPRLPFKRRSLFLQYAALSYAAEARIRFRYRILGEDSEWTETRERSLRFEGLPAGHYNFQVIAAGSDDLWTPVPAEFSFSIAPPWWQTWWLLTACLVAAVLLVSTLWRWRMRVLTVQKQLLERLVAERTAELTQSHHRLEEIANSDVLTLLPNRRRFTQQFRARLELGLSLRERFALLLIDLDRFKQINDTFGHDAGDAVLVETAQRLRGTVRDADCVARLGGDEFAILIFDAYEKAMVERICERIVGYGHSGITFNGKSLHVGTSVGIAMYPEDGDTETSLYKAADLALYEAKRTKSGFRFGHSQRPRRQP